MPRLYHPRARVVLEALLEDFGDGSDPKYTYDVIPREVTVEQNDHRTADTVQVELDYRDFPIDPRIVRDCKVAVYMGDGGDPDLTFLPDDDPRFLVFQGHLDEPETSLDESGEVVRFKGRDFTALFLDKKWVGGSLRIDRPLSQIIDLMIDLTPGADGLIVAFSAGADDVTPSRLIGRTKHTPKPGDDHWTILVDICGRVGLLPVIELGALRILGAGEIEAGRQTAHFIYGENVAKLRYTKKTTTTRNQQIQVTCWDETARETRSGIYPPEPIVTKKKIAKSGKVTTDKEAIVPYFVSGTFTARDCVDLAQRIYEESARNEVEGTIETRDLQDLYAETDLWLLRNGDALTVRLGTNILAAIENMPQGERVEFLTAKPRSFTEAAATALSKADWQMGDSETTFYVNKATHTWSRKDGYRLEVGFKNYAVNTG